MDFSYMPQDEFDVFIAELDELEATRLDILCPHMIDEPEKEANCDKCGGTGYYKISRYEAPKAEDLKTTASNMVKLANYLREPIAYRVWTNDEIVVSSGENVDEVLRRLQAGVLRRMKSWADLKTKISTS